MGKNLRLFLLVLLLMSSSTLLLQSQVPLPKRNTNKDQSAQSQRQIDDQLARSFYNNKQYDKAADLYSQLYVNYHYYSYFSQYVECLFMLEKYEEAEKELRSFIKNDNTSNKWKAQINLAFAYNKLGEKNKADKTILKLINELPEDKNVFLQTANNLISKDFQDYALVLYDKGSESQEIDYKFYMEKALLYHSMMNFDKSIENYLLHLEANPDSYNTVKSRLSFLLRYDVDGSIADIMRFALMEKAQENSENVMFSELLVWYSLQMKYYDIALTQEIAIDKRVGDRELDIMYLARIARDNEQYDIAAKAYKYIVDKSSEGAFYEEATVGLIEVEYVKSLDTYIYNDDSSIKFYTEFEKNIEKECAKFGINDETVPMLLIRADVLSFKLDDIENALAILNNALTINLSKLNIAKVKMKLADIYLYEDNVWEATLLYSQVDKSMKEEPIGHEARFKNAQLRYYIGEFDWALSVLNILKSATSKLIANDAMSLSLLIEDNLEYDTIALQRIARADFYIYQKRYDLANQMLDSVNIYNPNEVSMPYLLMRKAHIAAENNEYQLADSLYKRVYDGYADSYEADKALLEDAILLEKFLNNKEAAMQCYARLFDEYTASVYVAQARNAYRRLRDEL